MEAVIRQWQTYIQLGDKIRSQKEWGDRIHVVRFEDLKHNPAPVLKSVFEFIGLETADTLVEHILDETAIDKIKVKGEGHHVRSGGVGDWQHHLSTESRTVCHDIVGSTLAQLGYIQ